MDDTGEVGEDSVRDELGREQRVVVGVGARAVGEKKKSSG